MSAAMHTPEPWQLLDTIAPSVIGTPSRMIAECYDDGELLSDEDIANARRIVACVNFCADIETEELETQDMAIRNKTFEALEQRDELRASLAQLVEICRVKCGPNDEPILDGVSNHDALVNAVQTLERMPS